MNKTHPAPRRSLRPRQLANPRGSVLLTWNSLGTLKCFWAAEPGPAAAGSSSVWIADKLGHTSPCLCYWLLASAHHTLQTQLGASFSRNTLTVPSATWRPSLKHSGGSMLTEGGRWQPKPPQWPMPSARTDWLCCESCVASGATQTQGRPQSFWWRLEMRPGRGRAEGERFRNVTEIC